MSSEDARPEPAIRMIPVQGGAVAAYIYGETNRETVVCINGGPGASSELMRKSFASLARSGFRVIFHDQLGTGESDKPDDPSLWSLQRYAAEVEAVSAALEADEIHLLGHSWGGWLAVEYAVTYPRRLRTAIFSSTAANMPVHLEEVRRLLAAYGEETLAMVDRIEQDAAFHSPLCDAICTLFYNRHSSRKAYLANVLHERGKVNMQIQEALWGRAEFSATGELAQWNRLPDLRNLTIPALILVGAFDYLTPRSAALMAAAIPNASLTLFPDSGHLPYLDEPEAYFATIVTFLRANASTARRQTLGRL